MKTESRPVRILLVEDNRGDIYLIRESLQGSGLAHELTVLQDGEEAWNLLGRKGKYADTATPDLLILDLNVPRVSGEEILEFLRNDPRLMALPIVIMSSSVAPQDRERAEQLRHGLYLTKPSDLDEFLNMGQKIRRFWETAQ